jgi:phosphatidate cytidylyltransferase
MSAGVSQQGPAARGLPDDLKKRALSGAALIAIAAVELIVGGSLLVASVALLTAAMIWEALNLTGVKGVWRRTVATAIAAIAILTQMPDLPGGALPVWAALGMMTGTLLFAYAAARDRKSFPFGMVAAASVCVGCLVIVLSETRADFYQIPPLLVLIPAVIGTDIGAYFTGRALGGPKLAPAVSPNKTWSGAIGGAVCAVGAGLATLWLAGLSGARAPMAEAVALLFALSVCAQIGDLIESWLKRRAGVKDSGRLIPGHGGVLDRFDGFLGAAVLGLGPWLLVQELGGGAI